MLPTMSVMISHHGPVILITTALNARQEARLLEIASGARLVREPDLAKDPTLAGQVEICYPHMPPDLWARAERLKWVQSSSAGVEKYIAPPEARRHSSVFTNVHIHAHSVPQHLWGLALMLSRNLHGAVRAQLKATWDRDGVMKHIGALTGEVLCVAGLGALGTQCAQIGRLFGMRVIGISRHARPNQVVDEVVGPEKRCEVFAESRLIMLVLPATEETRGFVGKRELDVMKGAWLVNGGRGPAVVTDELMRALQDGRVRGAGLDVTDPEPLPDGHPLWKLSNVIITPHYGGERPGYMDDAFSVFCENLRRWIQSEKLQNVVDKTAGY
jgi:D-2-hydroxyacid dehydrogenase (NADP+)